MSNNTYYLYFDSLSYVIDLYNIILLEYVKYRNI